MSTPKNESATAWFSRSLAEFVQAQTQLNDVWLTRYEDTSRLTPQHGPPDDGAPLEIATHRANRAVDNLLNASAAWAEELNSKRGN